VSVAVARRHPPWLKVRAPGGPEFAETTATVHELGLHTVCQEARCPNIGECWGHRTATFMLLGDTCTRNCGFCAVMHGHPLAVDPGEPLRVARAVARLGLRHVVVTSVNRDDLPDGGAAHFAGTAGAIKALLPGCCVEVLVPDFQGRLASVAEVVASPIDVFNHNLETVPRLYRRVRAGARYERSLSVLEAAARGRPGLLTKTGLMLGLGEGEDELTSVFKDLRSVRCDVLTLGQYLRPGAENLAVERYVPPEEFAALRETALGLGFRHVEAGPLVRSSYHAWSHVPPA
jgi:lipoic acid synthetase